MVATIAARLGIDPSRASRLVTELISEGYAARAVSQQDARRTIVTLTDKGNAVVTAVRTIKYLVLGTFLSNWSEEEMNTLTVRRAFGPDLQMGNTDLKVYSYWVYVSSFHPDGLTQDPEDETAFIFTLAAMIRTLYWEALTHVRTIQRLKTAQGLVPVVEVPREGYLLDPFFWGPGDEPRM